MSNATITFAKLAGVLKSVNTILEGKTSGLNRPVKVFSPDEVGNYFQVASVQLKILKEELNDLYGDISELTIEPQTKMSDIDPHPFYFSRRQLESLSRLIEQIFEIRANSELASPVPSIAEKVFISHGKANDWHDVQNFIEKDLKLPTLELAQEANLGRSIMQKLEEESSKCTFAVIVMTGDDYDSDGKARVRENVMHEIGYFQGKFGLSSVCLLHEEGTSIPSNIHGLVYIPFPKGYINATFGALMREIKAFYK